MYAVRTTTGLSATACTLDDVLDHIWQHLTNSPVAIEGGFIGWTIRTYDDRSWSGELTSPIGDGQSLAEELGQINARLVLAHLAGAVPVPAGTRLHFPVDGPNAADDAEMTQPVLSRTA